MSSPNTLEKSAVHLDDILTKFPLSSRYYVENVFMICLVNIASILLISEFIFTAEKVSYRCLDERFGNDSCASLSNSTEVCTVWVYDDPHSFVAEFDLACQEWKRTLVGTMMSVGYTLSLLMVGPLSDRWGRKPLTVITLIFSSVFGVAKSFATNYWGYIILQLIGAWFGNAFSSTYILTIEMVAHEKRVLTKSICNFALAVGNMILALVAWLFPYWRHMLLVLYAPGILFISYTYLLDESPRWLLSKGRKDKAVTILIKMAKKCKVKIDKDTLDKISYKRDVTLSLMQSLNQTFRSKLLLRRFLMCVVWWTIGSYILYGIRVNSVLLPGNKYINFTLMALVAIPGQLLMWWMLNTFTRKTSLVSSFFFCAIVLLAEPFIPENSAWLAVSLFLLGQLLARTIYSIIYIFTSELFPTNTRNSTHSLCSAFGRTGAILAPQTPLLVDYWVGLPSLTFGTTSLLAGLVTLFAPKTTNEVLPNTVQQAEAIGDNQYAVKDIEMNKKAFMTKHREQKFTD